MPESKLGAQVEGQLTPAGELVMEEWPPLVTVREYWIVYPEYFQIQVFDLINEKFVSRGTYVTEDLIPVGIFEGFFIDATALFK